ncbi:MAG: hypothetical protein ACK5X3_12265 [Pseudomonadota bacterium]
MPAVTAGELMMRAALACPDRVRVTRLAERSRGGGASRPSAMAGAEPRRRQQPCWAGPSWLRRLRHASLHG